MLVSKEQKPQKVLHLTTHLGGGVGSVLLNYLAKVKDDHEFKHQVICLGYTDTKVRSSAKAIKLPLADKMSSQHEKIITAIAETDIVVIHWWNHPLLYDFLVRRQLPPSRVVLWSHVSGFYAPQIFTPKILDYPDLFVFTTPISLQSKEVKGLEARKQQKLRVIWSTSGVGCIKGLKPKSHKGFNVGYIGTVDYAKIHKNFLDLCNKVNIPNVKFIVCGGAHEKEIALESIEMGIGDKFQFTGQVSDIKRYLSRFDIFGYPLTPHHYGTCDQVLVESMAAGVVPVVLSNQMEAYMVKNGVTGIVAKTPSEYTQAIEMLHRNSSLRRSLSQNAKKYATKTFSVDKMRRDWVKVYREVLTLPKTTKNWSVSKKNRVISAKDVFLESLGHGEKIFTEGSTKKIRELGRMPVWQSTTKGTVHNYFSYFPNDKHLGRWSRLMKLDDNHGK